MCNTTINQTNHIAENVLLFKNLMLNFRFINRLIQKQKKHLFAPIFIYLFYILFFQQARF